MDIFCAGQLPTTHKPVRECTSPQWAVLADQSVAKANEEMKKRLEFHWQLQAKELKQDHIYSGIFLTQSDVLSVATVLLSFCNHV